MVTKVTILRLIISGIEIFQYQMQWKDPKAGGDSTAISPDTVLGFQDFFAQNISANIFPFFAPFN